MAQDYEINVRVNGLDEASRSVEGFTESLDEASNSGGAIEGQLDKMTGGAVTGFRKAAQGTKSFITGLKLTRGAVIATGIGALVVAVVALVQAFTKTRRGARMLKVAMAAFGAVVDQIVARIQNLGGFIVDLFSEGPIAAINNYNNAMDDLPPSMSEAVKQAIALEKATQALTDRQREFTVASAEGRRTIKEQNKIAEDTTKTLEEREAAAQKAIDTELALMAERKSLLDEEFRIAEAKAKMTDSTDEDLQRLADLTAQRIDMETQSLELQTTLNNKLNTIRQQAAAAAEAEAKRVADAARARRKARKDAADAIIAAENQVLEALEAARLSREDQRTQEEAAAKKTYEERVKLAGNNAELLAQVEEEYRNTLIDIDDKYQAQAKAKEEEANKKRAEAEKAATEYLAAQSRTAREQELFDLDANYAARILAVKDNAELVAQLEEDQRNKKRELQDRYDKEDAAANKAKIDKDLADAKAALEAEMSLRTEYAKNTFSILSNLNEAFSKKGEEQSKKSFQRTKAISIAETLVSTYLSAQAAFASQFKPLATIDSPIRGALAAGAAVAGGLARVAAIKAQQYNGGGGGAGTAATGGGFSGGTQSVGVDVGSLIPNQQTPTPEPVRAYIVENEISNKQALNRELQIQTTL